MASTYSSNLKIELIGTGDQSGTWGITANTNLGTTIEEAIVGRAAANFTTDADLTLSLTDSNLTQVARAFVLNVTSGVSLTTTRNLVVPTINKPYLVQNNTTGGQSIVIKTSAGTGVTVRNGSKAYVYADGTNVITAFDYTPRTTSTGSATLPVGTTAQRDASPAAGYIRFNTSTIEFEGYTGSVWRPVGGAAEGGGTDAVFFENDQAVTTNYSITTGKNAMSAGPVSINSGVTVTVPTGSVWTIV